MRLLFLVASLTLPALVLAQTSRDTMIFRDTNQVYVIGVRTPLTREFVPYSVSQVHINAANESRTLADAIHGLPGLQLSDRQNYAVGERITNRGFGARTQFGVRGVKIIEDIIPATFADGQSATESIDPESIVFAELLQGPGSAMYGNAAGGVLLLRGDPAMRGGYSSQMAALGARATFGSYGFEREGVSLFARPTELVTMSGNYSHLTSDGYRAHSAAKTTRGDLRGFLPIASDDDIQIDGRYTEFHALSPGALTQAEYDTNARIAAASSIKANAGKDGHQNQIAALWDHRMSAMDLRISSYIIGRTLTNPIVGKIIGLARTAGGVDLTLAPRREASEAASLLWNLGASLAMQNDDRTSYANLSGVRGDINLDQNENVTTIAGFGALTWTPLTDLSAMAALRYDRALFSVTDHYITGKDPDDSGDRTMDALSPSLGVIWRFTDSFHLFGNVSTSFETPTTSELSNQASGAGGFNPDLDPQRAVGVEAGVRGSLLDDVRVSLTGYRTDIRDELIAFEVPGAPGRSYYRNAGTARHQGVEASLAAIVLDSLQLSAAFSAIDARYREYAPAGASYAGNKVPGIASTLLDITADLHAPLGFHASVTWMAVGRSFADDANAVVAPGYSIVNLSLENSALRLGDVWGASLAIAAGIENLLDTKYISSVVVNAAANRYFEPGPGRSYWLTARLALDRTAEPK
jgi:iron complex outermembrane receptor protein